MLAVAHFVNRSRAWYERKPGIPAYAECCPVSGKSSVG
jgi:ACR3 family arsenite transporter